MLLQSVIPIKETNHDFGIIGTMASAPYSTFDPDTLADFAKTRFDLQQAAYDNFPSVFKHRIQDLTPALPRVDAGIDINSSFKGSTPPSKANRPATHRAKLFSVQLLLNKLIKIAPNQDSPAMRPHLVKKPEKTEDRLTFTSLEVNF